MIGLIIMVVMGIFIVWVIIQAQRDIKKQGLGKK